MKRLLSYSLLCTASLTLMPIESFAKADCAAIAKRNFRKDVSVNPADMVECTMRGYDAPKTSREAEGKSSGVRVQGSGGFSYGTIAAPENSPGAMGAPPSVGAQTIGNAFGNQGWPGFPCTLPGGINLCNLGVTPTPPVDPDSPEGSCPVKYDKTNRYGVKYTLTGGNIPLACGGAMPLASYEITLNRTPDRLASTEYGSYYIWLYENKGGTFKQVAGSPFKLPTLLCKKKIDPITRLPMIDPTTRKEVRDWAVDLTPPTAQMITYNAETKSMTLRLIPSDEIPTDDGGMPKEKFLIIPIESGTPKLPTIPKTFSGHGDNPANYSYTDCSLAEDYYKDVSNSQADIVIESAITEGCEGPEAVCGGRTQAPTTNDSCETISIYPTGTAGTNVCQGKIQYAVLDRPNLIYPPNSTLTTYPMEGRTSVLAATTKDSKIYMQGDTLVRIGKTASLVTLPDGGTLTLADGTNLLMNGPTTIDPATNTITMKMGGMHKSAGGVMLEKLPVGTTFNPSGLVYPLRISVYQSLDMPEGYLVPTQPSPFVQVPADRK